MDGVIPREHKSSKRVVPVLREQKPPCLMGGRRNLVRHRASGGRSVAQSRQSLIVRWTINDKNTPERQSSYDIELFEKAGVSNTGNSLIGADRL